MKNMYAIKCLYQYKFYDKNDQLLKDIIPGWEEKIILIKASNTVKSCFFVQSSSSS